MTQQPPFRGSTGTRRRRLHGALGGARMAHATVQPSGQGTGGVHGTCAMPCWLPQTEAELAPWRHPGHGEGHTPRCVTRRLPHHSRHHPHVSPLSCVRHASVTSAMMAWRVRLEATPLAHTRATPTPLTASGAGERRVWPGTRGRPGWSQPWGRVVVPQQGHTSDAASRAGPGAARPGPAQY